VSVVLLGIPAMKSAMEEPVMLASLLAGLGLSVAGMALRWHSHRVDQKEKDARGPSRSRSRSPSRERERDLV
jgi:hypothetical protein